jgi:Cd2+/Zn2+-exporting ATPase
LNKFQKTLNFHTFLNNDSDLNSVICTGPEMDDHRGASIGYVIVDGDLVGAFSLSDDCRTGAAEAIRELRSMGIKSVMLTGDSRAAATRAQQQLGGVLEELHSELLPADKVGLVGGLKARAGPTLMVGDGMNDAPALAAADVGVSMGLSGSAAAMETSHATLMSSDILRVPAAVALGRRTRANIAANVLVSVGAKAAVLALAVAWRPMLWAAVLADVGTCLLVVLHSMLLLREPGTGSWRRRGGKAEACRATARSLAMRSQLDGALNGGAAAESAQQGPSGGAKAGCRCCQKPSEPFEQEHAAVVIDIPAPSADAEHPRATAKGGATGCCGAAREACDAPTTVTTVDCAPRGCCGGKGKGDGRVSARTSCCSNGGGGAARDSPKKAGKGCSARCCSSGK